MSVDARTGTALSCLRRPYGNHGTKTEADKIVEALRQCPYSKDAAIIGEVTADQPGKVVMTTEIGTQALLPQPGGELLPRIC